MGRASIGVTMKVALSDEHDPELAVVEAIRGGDRFAFAEFVRRQNRFVRATVIGVLGMGDRVDDVCQNVWTAVWQRIGKLKDAARWRPWLYRLAHNAAIDAGRDITRRKARLEVLQSASAGGAAEQRATPDGSLLADERHAAVRDAIQGLPALYREPFVFRHINHWSYRQIAELMQIPIDSIETRLVRARRMLRETLKDRIKP